MGDPFADLLTQFKQDDTKLKDQNEDTLGSAPSLSQGLPSNHIQSSPEMHSINSPIYDSCRTTNTDDFEELFGPISSANPIKVPSNALVQDEFDTAFDLLQTASSKPDDRIEKIPKEPSKIESESEPVVDEVRDMEVARLMSLGFSINDANMSYDKGVLYEDLIEERKRLKQQKRRERRQTAQANWESEDDMFRNDTARESNVDLFSIASGIFNKGKKFMDQLTAFPEERENAGEKEVYIAKETQPKPFQKSERNVPIHARKNLSMHQQSQGQLTETDLLSDFEEKLTMNKEQAPSASPLPISEAEATPTPASTPTAVAATAAKVAKAQDHERLLDFDDGPVDAAPQEASQVPTVPISEIELSGYNEFKDRAAELFKNGDYVTAMQIYEKSANTLPHDHPLRIISLSNLIASRLKTGEYKECLRASEIALSLFPEDVAQWTQTIQNSQPPRSYRDMWPKISLRRAEAFEHSENYKDAFKTYQSLVESNFCTDIILEGKRRCQKALEPKKFELPKKSSSPSVAPPREKKHYENLGRVQENNRKQREIDAEKDALYDQVQAKIEAWTMDKPDDIRHLLSNLQTVLTWCDWKEVPITDLVMPKKVKVNYLKAVAKTHPDKIPASLPLEPQMLAACIFSSLSLAWERFKTENDIS